MNTFKNIASVLEIKNSFPGMMESQKYMELF